MVACLLACIQRKATSAVCEPVVRVKTLTGLVQMVVGG